MKGQGTQNIMVFIKKTARSVFTTHEITALSGKSESTVIQCLNRLSAQGLLTKIYRGVWAEVGAQPISPFSVIAYLFPRQRVYVSFISALHLHGMVEQIPQVITLASMAHTRTLRTKVGIYTVHQILPRFFCGFDWYQGDGSFLIAEPEKALIDSLYLSSRKKKQYGIFPELTFPKKFSFRRAVQWADRIPADKLRRYVRLRLRHYQQTSGRRD
ncbi:MAG: type IV toxin-antitoxin system AbiEi family antitoxin domain-containing protein [Candidatus Omnitrophica bacterium]|nr:type IV toxin-antitoxin system AbiEi family antitoxin domain-containing protein [Candidatus Omnitrophota bacterium]